MRYLITGITGTLAQEVSKRLLDTGHWVTGISRDEQKQRLLPQHPRLRLVLGDIRDGERIIEASEDVDLIFHFASLKCVDTLEHQPSEALQTNILGTQNVLIAQKVHRIDRVVFTSTDKACYPINSYGFSKALAEKLVLQNSRNVVCRYGNVIASRGSAIPMFVYAIQNKLPVMLTHESMSRFFIRVEDAAQFVIDQSRGMGGGLKITEMKRTSIVKVIDAISKILNIPYDIQVTGLRAGEKINECLKMAHEGSEVHSHTASQFTEDELKALLEPSIRMVA
jgi:UDP-N-acetylglucosamine 4,6-dehydratase